MGREGVGGEDLGDELPEEIGGARCLPSHCVPLAPGVYGVIVLPCSH